LNSNKCNSADKESMSSTSGATVKKRKYRKYDDSYLEFGFTSTEIAWIQDPFNTSAPSKFTSAEEENHRIILRQQFESKIWQHRILDFNKI
jgi:hypothetical protein